MGEKSRTFLGVAGALGRFLAGLLFGVVIPVAILGAGGYGAYYLLETAPQAQREEGSNGEIPAQLVEATQLTAVNEQIVVEAMGLVSAARTVSLQPQVEGEIVEIHPNLERGGYIARGETAIRISPRDYELALKQAKADVAQMESALDLEMGQQEIARKEFELLGEDTPKSQASLVLRQPQLESAKADLERARAAVEAAELDLERTTIKAPMNALVQSELAEVGGIARTGNTIASLVGTDRFWVELSVPVDNLRWIELPGPDGTGGSLVRIYDKAAWGPDSYRQGRVVRYAASLDETSRMATLVVAVEDPLAMQPMNSDKPKLLLGSYVTGMIYGSEVPDAITVAREHLREDNTVWVMDRDDKLEIRQVNVLWRGKTEVIVSAGLQHGERIVTSKLSAPVDGMRLRTRDEATVEEETDPSLDEQVETEETQISRADV